MSGNIIDIRRPFDPDSKDAEDRYNHVASRINRLRGRRRRLDAERDELERQFVENDLVVASGRRKGLTLTRQGRRKRLERLLELDHVTRQLDGEERFLRGELARMNVALELWARKTYGF